jgi:ribosomal protein L13
MLKKLKVYKGGDHPHKAQMPETLDAKEVRRA